MPTTVSIEVTYEHSKIICTMHLSAHRKKTVPYQILLLCGACPQINLITSSYKTTAIAITPLLARLTSTTFSHNSSLPCRPHHQIHLIHNTTAYISFLQFPASLNNILSISIPANNTSILSYSLTSPFPLRLPMLLVPSSTSKIQSVFLSQCMLQDIGLSLHF